MLFEGKARCATCHVKPIYTEPGWNLHTPAEIGIDDFQASRSPDERYRTAPLGGLWTHQKGGFYHRHFALGLTERQSGQLVEYLKSLPPPRPRAKRDDLR